MFDLDKAVADWCANAGFAGNGNELEDELRDHLYCEIEALVEEGIAVEQAFVLATKKLGEPGVLLDEYQKHRNVFSRLCELERDATLTEFSQQRNHVMHYKQSSSRIRSQSVIWATVLLSSALLLGESQHYTAFLLLMVVLALASIAMDPGYKEVARAETRYICRLLGMRRGRPSP